jgi:hypothetical protein
MSKLFLPIINLISGRNNSGQGRLKRMGLSTNNHLNKIEIMFYNVPETKDIISTRSGDLIRGDRS